MHGELMEDVWDDDQMELLMEVMLEQEEQEEEDDMLLPGFRFNPTDEELLLFYLQRKVAKKPFKIDLIMEIDIYKHDPWDLSKMNTVGNEEKEWYFFCLRGKKYRNSIRPNRVTPSGFWKATGIDKPIYPKNGGNTNCIGLKKTLVYYRGSGGKGTKTNWMMHEFRLPPESVHHTTNMRMFSVSKEKEMHEADNWTVCRIFERNVSSHYKKRSSTKLADHHPIPHTPSVDLITSGVALAPHPSQNATPKTITSTDINDDNEWINSLFLDVEALDFNFMLQSSPKDLDGEVEMKWDDELERILESSDLPLPNVV